MKLNVTLTQILKDWNTDEYIATFTFKSDEDAEHLRKLLNVMCDMDIVKHTEKRSQQANKFFWACVGELSKALKTDPWSVYLFLLNRYGIFTYVEISEEGFAMFETQWREVQIISTENGMHHCLCYLGSSKYNKEDFSRLIDGAISELNEIGVKIPATQRDMEKLMRWLKG